MADPTKFTPGYGYADFQASNPSTPLPGNRVDTDMANIATSVSEIVDAVTDVRRSDGALNNGIVTPESLSALVVTMLATAGLNYRGAWLTGTAYALEDYVLQGGSLYFCASAHTSGTFATDLAATKWVALTLSSASGVSFTPSGTIAATNVQSAIAELNTEAYAELTAIKANNWVTTVRISDSNVTAAKLAATLDLSTKTLTLPSSCVDASNLASTLDLSSKTVTLPAASVTAAMLAGTVDLTGKVVVLPNGATGVTASASDNSAKIATTAYVDGAVAAVGTELGTAQTTTSGTSADFTGIPATAREISINFIGFSTNGSDNYLVQLGDSGGVETSGYLGASTRLAAGPDIAAANSTAGFIIYNSGGAPNVIHGSLVIRLENATNNTWSASGVLGRSDSAATIITGGSKSLSATLDRVRVTTTGGTNTFDAGEINVSWRA